MSSSARPKGALLVNLGTPDSPGTSDVRAYLREFLSDPRVLEMPAAARWLLLNLVILPSRPRRSAEAYAKIWTPEGSPLLVHGRALAEGVAERLGEEFRVELGMRYGAPSIRDAVGRLLAQDVTQIVMLPLFPQYSNAATGSAVTEVYEALADSRSDTPLRVAGSFFDHPAFIEAQRAVIGSMLDDFAPDHMIMSFHGLPVSHLRHDTATRAHCLTDERCCDSMCEANRSCYRAQCFATARALTRSLDLDPERTSVAFQSRLGRTAWIDPDLPPELERLRGQGVERVAVLCPAFVADCLETLEEVGIRASEQWRSLGGKELLLLPCVNAHPSWIEGAAQLVRENTTADPVHAADRDENDRPA
jgi:ferrochelatase